MSHDKPESILERCRDTTPRDLRNMMRLIQLQALALGFGGSFFALAGYLVFQRLGAPALDLGDFSLVMVGFYSLGALLGRWRYR